MPTIHEILTLVMPLLSGKMGRHFIDTVDVRNKSCVQCNFYVMQIISRVEYTTHYYFKIEYAHNDYIITFGLAGKGDKSYAQGIKYSILNELIGALVDFQYLKPIIKETPAQAQPQASQSQVNTDSLHNVNDDLPF